MLPYTLLNLNDEPGEIDMTLLHATAERDAARGKMNSNKIGSKMWREAEEDLTFWTGKVAMLGRLPK